VQALSATKTVMRASARVPDLGVVGGLLLRNWSCEQRGKAALQASGSFSIDLSCRGGFAAPPLTVTEADA
jgi:hypothetical protein